MSTFPFWSRGAPAIGETCLMRRCYRRRRTKSVFISGWKLLMNDVAKSHSLSSRSCRNIRSKELRTIRSAQVTKELSHVRVLLCGYLCFGTFAFALSRRRRCSEHAGAQKAPTAIRVIGLLETSSLHERVVRRVLPAAAIAHAVPVDTPRAVLPAPAVWTRVLARRLDFGAALCSVWIRSIRVHDSSIGTRQRFQALRAHRVADGRLGGLPGAFFGAQLELEELDGDRLALGLRVEELTELRARGPLAVPLPAVAHAERVILEPHVAARVGERRTRHQRVQARAAPIARQPLRLVIVLHTRHLVLVYYPHGSTTNGMRCERTHSA